MTRATTGAAPANGTASPGSRTDCVRALNDAMRRGAGGRWMITAGVEALGAARVAEAVAAVRRFDGFDADNDPYGERDFGAFALGGERLFWKIDAYDRSLRAGSPDPADPAVTVRVLTIMLAGEY
ncbi:MAG TPA: DUF3768 domain-containing protein [Stellaceae bacterium]|nr:DUF3768 domain-containing protein [Stellaceae bacterium]